MTKRQQPTPEQATETQWSVLQHNLRGATLDLGTLGPLTALRTLQQAAQELDALQAQCVEVARSQGRSWAQIGDALGVSKQATAKRYGVSTPATVAGPTDPELPLG